MCVYVVLKFIDSFFFLTSSCKYKKLMLFVYYFIFIYQKFPATFFYLFLN